MRRVAFARSRRRDQPPLILPLRTHRHGEEPAESNLWTLRPAGLDQALVGRQEFVTGGSVHGRRLDQREGAHAAGMRGRRLQRDSARVGTAHHVGPVDAKRVHQRDAVLSVARDGSGASDGAARGVPAPVVDDASVAGEGRMPGDRQTRRR